MDDNFFVLALTSQKRSELSADICTIRLELQCKGIVIDSLPDSS